MGKNNNLHSAKRAKNDEFYTQLEDVEKECCHYVQHFIGKKILCNCNDQKYTAFKDYFKINYKTLQLSELICTSFEKDGHGELYRYDGENEHISQMTGNGGFNTPEGIELIKEADIIVTNPPFSLFREFVATLEEYGKKYLILGNMNAITYKEIFPLIKDNKLWIGVNAKGGTRKGNSLSFQNENGTLRDISSWWFTNLDHSKRHEPLDLYKHYTPEEYPKYDNYDAINVDKTCDIPMDYNGVMGVPISFLEKYCPEQFEIIGEMVSTTIDQYNFGYPYICGKKIYARILIKQEIIGIANNSRYIGDFECYTKISGKTKYARILIKQETKWIR